MKKKLLSLALALAACLSLAVPASATNNNNTIQIWNDGVDGQAVFNDSGNGWSYDCENNEPGVLKLSGAQNLDVSFNGSCVIELAPGTKSSILDLSVEWANADGTEPVFTFRGSGELEICSASGDVVSYGRISEVKLENGLVMTGGAKRGDSYPVTLGPKTDVHKSGWYSRSLQANGVDAKYVHIGPAGGGAPASSQSGFPDVAPSSAFASAINWAVEQNIAAGYGDGTFRPGNTCTVSHILTFLWRANGRPGAGSDERAAVTAWAKGLGIDTGNLSDPCTRAMAVTYLWKAAGSPAPSKSASFADVPAGADYAKAVSWALEEGIAGGTGGNTFSPGGTCTRGQIVTFLYRQKA